MKKNKALTAAISVLSLTMVSLCAIGGTFAKYTTNNSKTDQAQVAKWGVTVTANLSDLYELGYNTDHSVANTKTDAAVFASASTNLLAPGTQDGQVDALIVTGTPEVAVSVDYNCDVTLTGWTTTGTDVYCPLVITVKVSGAEDKIFKIDNTLTTTTLLEEAIETYINDLDVSVDPNTNLAKNISLEWSWAYHVNDETDAKDVLLGNRADEDNPAVFGITLGCTVTQVD